MKMIKNLLVGAAVVGITGIANAIPTLYVSSTGLAGSWSAVATSATGVVSWTGSQGVWNLIVSTGLTKPSWGTAALPSQDLSIQASSTAGGSLYIGFADIGYTGVGAIGATVSGHVVSGAAETYTYTTFADVANTQPTTTIPTGVTVTSLSGSLPVIASATGSLPLTSPYTLGLVFSISSLGATSTSIDAGFAPVPDGGMTVAMLGLGLVAVEAARRKLAKA